MLTAWIGIFAGPQLILGSEFIEGNVINNLLEADYKAWIIVLYLAILMNCVGYSAWYHVLGHYEVNKIMPIMLLIPVTGIVSAMILLGERPDINTYIGGAVIIFGVSLILFNRIKN